MWGKTKKTRRASETARRFLALSTAVRPQVKEERETLRLLCVSLFKHYNTQNSSGVKTCSLFSQICFWVFNLCFAVDFLLFLSNLVFGSGVTEQEILKVTLLSTFYGEM